MGADVVIKGSVHAQGSVRLGKNTFVGGSVVTDGNVELHQNARVAKNIMSSGEILLRTPFQHFNPNPLNRHTTYNKSSP